MVIKKQLSDIQSFIAGDHTLLKEILHPKNEKTTLGFSLALAELGPRKSSLPHALEQSETYFFLDGKCCVTVNGSKFFCGKGDCLFIPPNAVQFVENCDGSILRFLCIVSPPWTEAGETVF